MNDAIIVFGSYTKNRSHNKNDVFKILIYCPSNGFSIFERKQNFGSLM
jgi:hypothetical protein